jgi:aspartyl-tRNA(Asn)/glutamyl-tRNA(Gln) amidotransferase subunit C
MSINIETVQRVARLSKLKLQDSDVALYAEQLSRIIHHMEKLSEINTDGVEPMFHACAEYRALREDVALEFDTDKLMASGINIKEKYFSVPNIISRNE